jgi:hypothetical protein
MHNKASQKDTKTVVSLWFSCPCWWRYAKKEEQRC